MKRMERSVNNYSKERSLESDDATFTYISSHFGTKKINECTNMSLSVHWW
jgi:hypothetical protein